MVVEVDLFFGGMFRFGLTRINLRSKFGLGLGWACSPCVSLVLDLRLIG